MRNVPPNDDDIDVQVCDDDDVFDMVNNGLLGQDIETKNLGNAKFEMLLILVFNKAFIEGMESKDLLTVNNLIVSLRLAVDVIEAAMNSIKYFDLDGDVKDDETEEGMEIVIMLKSVACDIQQQHDANGSAITRKRVHNE
ncbi:unnamed protein product [Sphagnum jensenii]|uniref:Uncharacterized protein n=1 Tax=Sphagnum jensenii TaxID=128206 RepID=A0ABP1AEY2_9BRYO